MEKPVVPSNASAKTKVMVFSPSFSRPSSSSIVTVFGATSATIDGYRHLFDKILVPDGAGNGYKGGYIEHAHIFILHGIPFPIIWLKQSETVYVLL